MKNRKMTIPILLSTLLLITLLAACGSSEPEDRIFNLEIHDGALVQGDPPLQVNQDDHVTIVVSSDEHVSFHLHGYDIEQEAEPGAPTTLVFTANATGSFPFTVHIEADEHSDGDDHEDEGEEIELGRLNVLP